MKCKARRRGFTLVEMMVSISVGTVLMVVTVGWIHQSLKFSSVMQQRQRQHTSLTRFAWQLRDDVRDSQSLAMADDNQLVLVAAGLKSTYTISDSSIVVEKRQSDPNVPPTREAYEFSPNSAIRWDSSELPNWISLIVSRRPQGNSLTESLPSAENSETRPIAGELMPVDLHVRVAPNRWTIASPTEGSAKPKQEVQK